MSKKQSKKKSQDQEQSKVDTPEKKQPKKKAAPPQSPKHEPPLTLESLKKQLDDLALHVQRHAEPILYYDAVIRRRHKMTSNGSVQILDKVAGKVYPSKNSAFQSLMLAK